MHAGTYTLTQGALLADSEVEFQGAGTRETTIEAGPAARVMVTSAAVSLSDLTLHGGDATAIGDDRGGVLKNVGGTVTLNAVHVANGTATYGGGIANVSGTMSIDRSLIEGNFASIGGGISNEGNPTLGSASLTITNSTIANNRGDTEGGGVALIGVATDSASFIYDTIAAQTTGGGIYKGDNAGTATAESTIVANNSSSDCSGTPLTSNGWNIEDHSGCGFTEEPDRQNVDAQLNAYLGDNGGPTATLLPALDSPAVNNREPGCPTFDQRGTQRPRGPRCDAGAVEIDYDVRIDSGPSGDTTQSQPDFTFSSSGASGYRCGFDTGTPTTPCNIDFMPDSPLGTGPHTFSVQAFDGNDQPLGSAVSRSFTVVAAAPPAPTVTTPADNPHYQNSTTVTFAGTGDDATHVHVDENGQTLGNFGVDGGTWGGELADVTEGTHTYDITRRQRRYRCRQRCRAPDGGRRRHGAHDTACAAPLQRRRGDRVRLLQR